MSNISLYANIERVIETSITKTTLPILLRLFGIDVQVFRPKPDETYDGIYGVHAGSAETDYEQFTTRLIPPSSGFSTTSPDVWGEFDLVQVFTLGDIQINDEIEVTRVDGAKTRFKVTDHITLGVTRELLAKVSLVPLAQYNASLVEENAQLSALLGGESPTTVDGENTNDAEFLNDVAEPDPTPEPDPVPTPEPDPAPTPEPTPDPSVTVTVHETDPFDIYNTGGS